MPQRRFFFFISKHASSRQEKQPSRRQFKQSPRGKRGAHEFYPMMCDRHAALAATGSPQCPDLVGIPIGSHLLRGQAVDSNGREKAAVAAALPLRARAAGRVRLKTMSLI
jgi:hypothetical protein